MVEMKQCLVPKKAKMIRYAHRMKGYEQKTLFSVDKKRFYREINGVCTDERSLVVNKEGSMFWSDIWSKEKERMKSAESLQELRQTVVCSKQAGLLISIREVKEVNKEKGTTRKTQGQIEFQEMGGTVLCLKKYSRNAIL